MNSLLLLEEIWQSDTHWKLGKDTVRGIHLWNQKTGVATYADTVEEVIRKVWMQIYGGTK